MAKHEMSTTQIHAFMAQLTEARALRRQARVHASALIQVFHIRPYGIDLVLWLADASCRNNEDAVIHWVQGQLASAGAPGEFPDLDELTSRMSRCLEAVRESFAN